jgi:hypothetical protein
VAAHAAQEAADAKAAQEAAAKAAQEAAARAAQEAQKAAAKKAADEAAKKEAANKAAIEIFNAKCTGEGGKTRTFTESEMAITYPFGHYSTSVGYCCHPVRLGGSLSLAARALSLAVSPCRSLSLPFPLSLPVSVSLSRADFLSLADSLSACLSQRRIATCAWPPDAGTRVTSAVGAES